MQHGIDAVYDIVTRPKDTPRQDRAGDLAKGGPLKREDIMRRQVTHRRDLRRNISALAIFSGLLTLLVAGFPVDVMAQGSERAEPTVALVGINVLPLDGPRVLSDQIVLIADGHIQSVGPRGSIEVPEGADVYDLPGHWVLPGLIDMHVHVFSEDELPLYLDAGITSVRNMWGWDMHLGLRDAVASGSMIGPRVFTSGRLLDGDPPVLRGSAALSTPAEAREEVARQTRAGFDGIKVYDGLSPDVFAAVMLAAKRAGLPVWGHPPESVGVHGALAVRITTLEHLRGVPEALGAGDEGWSDSLDLGAIADLALRFREAGTTVVPTLIVHESAELSAAEQQTLLESPAVAGIPEALRSFCCGGADDPKDDLDPNIREQRHRNRRDVVAALHSSGVRLLVGSDTGNRWVVPGAAFHEEIRLLREAGLATFEVLRAATRDAAVELDAATKIGGIRPGMAADLIIVSANPLERPGALRRPEAVMVGGRWHRRPSR